MVSAVQTGVGSQNQELAFARRDRNLAAAEPVVSAQAERRSVQVTASSTSTVTISGQTQRSHSFLSSGVETYQAVGDAPPQSRAAENILSAISARLTADDLDGATDEEIASRLQAGFDGFVTGFNEAFEELSEAGLLSPEVEQAINQTFDAVLAGIDELAANFGVVSPVDQSEIAVPSEGEDALEAIAEEGVASDEAETQTISSQVNTPIQSAPEQAPRDVFAQLAESILQPGQGLNELLDATTLNYESLIDRDFSFNLQTRDGDNITITASSSRNESVSAGNGSVAVVAGQSNAFELQVDGELDADELAAINDLLAQVGDLSETFFSGNIEEAFEQALEIGFDSSEIANFSLDLRQQVTTRVEATYTEVQDLAGNDRFEGGLGENLRLARDNDSLSRLRGFVEILQNIGLQADQAGVSRDQIPDIAANIANAQRESAEAGERLRGVLERLVPELS